jgi:hypothetical protein
MSSLTWRISAESAVFPGQHHTRTGMPSRVTAMPITAAADDLVPEQVPRWWFGWNLELQRFSSRVAST